MDGKLIEKLDKQRYWAVLLEATGLLIGFIQTLVFYIKQGIEPEMFGLVFGGSILSPLTWLVLLLLLAGGIWYGVIYLRVRRSRQLREALYNEMYRQHKYRYQRWALWVMIGACILSIISAFAGFVPGRYPHVVVSEMIMLSGLLTIKLSWLILNRR